MSARRGGNRIRGPQSALTDFLAANNISAAQIRDDYDRRLADALRPGNGEGSSRAAPVNDEQEDEEDDLDDDAQAAQAIANSRKRKRELLEVASALEDDFRVAAYKRKVDQLKKKKKAGGKKGKKGKSSDDEWDDGLDMYSKSRPMPGQFEHCELCNKRFTVTPYSKEGPDGGLLCTPCGKQHAKDVKKEEKALQKKPAGRKRRQNESKKLDGEVTSRVKSLQQLCIERVVQHHDQVSELGDIPPLLLDKLSAIFSKKRVMNSKTLKLFIRPDLDAIAIHDAAYLEVDDYLQLFAEASGVTKLVLRNACQLKDEVIEYMLDKCENIKYLQLYAANLISDDMWIKIFKTYGKQLNTVKLTWLDATFNDSIVAAMVEHCPNVTRLKLKLLRRIGEGAVQSISNLKQLEHLSLRIGTDVTPETLVTLIKNVGEGLKTLSLEHFLDLDDSVLLAIRENCKQLSKLRVCENDTASDNAFAQLFTDWSNPPLSFIDFNTTRHVDNNNPDGPEEAIGLSDAAFKAMIDHSGQSLKHLDLASCRHISLQAFNDVFDGKVIYPALETINISFCSCVDTRTVAGIFKSCPTLQKVIAFGCFDVLDVIVPRGVVLIGVPKAQDAIEQIGVALGVDEALLRMQEIEAAA